MALDPKQYRASRPPIDSVVGASGAEYPIPDPMLWPDGTQQATNDGDFAAACRGILGADAYDDFTAAGGTAAMLMDHIGTLLGDSRGESSLGESSASES